MRMKRQIAEPQDGELILLRDRYQEPSYSLWEITSHDKENVNLRKKGDTGETVAIGRMNLTDSLKGSKYEAVWTEAVPDLDPEVMGKMLSLLDSSRYTNHAFMFEVGSKDEQGAQSLTLLGNSSQDNGEEAEMEIYLDREFVEVTPKSDRLFGIPSETKAEYTEGTVLLLRPLATSNGNHAKIMLSKAEAVETGMTRNKAEEFLTKTSGPFQTPVWPVGGQEEFDMEIGQCLARHDDDQIIVLSLDTGNIDRPDNAYAVLDLKGAKLYWNDCLTDELWGTPIGHGIWIGTDIAWYDAGEDGAEWEANWGKATISDLIKNNVSIDDVGESIADLLERDVTRADLRGLLADEWDNPFKSNEDEDIDTIAKQWIDEMSELIKHCPDREVIREGLETCGFVLTLKASGLIQAVATVQHDSNGFYVLTRWANEDLKDRSFDKRLSQWKDSRSDG